MTEFRKLRPEDTPALVGLWHDVFGDPASYVEAFFRILPEIGGGVAAFAQNRLLGAAYMLCGQSLIEPRRERRCGYLYAVAVRPEARGRGVGATLCRETAALAEEQRCDILVTRPAEPGLFDWYARILGLRPALWRETRLLAPLPAALPVQRLDAAAYAARREALLADRPHLRLDAASMRLEQANCTAFGGALYAVGEGIAAATMSEGVLELRELLGAAEPEAAALGATLGAQTVLLHRSADTGEACLAASQPLPAGTVWNLAFD